MLQIGRFLCRGQGAMLVTGPLGAALVPLDFADSAADVVWGRADTQAFLSHVQAEKGDVLLLDCAGEQPYLTVLGSIQLRMRAAGQITEQVWTDPIWAWPFNPGEWQTFEATIVDGDEVTWMVPAADRVEAGEIRIGRALDEVEALASMPVDTMGFLINPDIPDHERRARRDAREELPEPSTRTSSVDLAAVEAQFLAATSNGPISLSHASRTPDAEEVPEATAEHVEEPPEEAPAKEAEQPSGELVSLREQVDRAAADLKTTGRYRTALRVVVTDEPVVTADPLEMELVALNLMKNALEASDAAGGAGEVVVTLFEEDERAIITVADDGGGTRETVERLNRGLGSTKAEGLGLGLSIVRGILEAYGGRLAFSARRQGGLVARVTVPVREVSGEPSPLDDDSLATGDNAVRDNRDEKAS